MGSESKKRTYIVEYFVYSGFDGPDHTRHKSFESESVEASSAKEACDSIRFWRRMMGLGFPHCRKARPAQKGRR